MTELNEATIIVWTFVGVMILAWGGLMLWGRRSGQFRRIEEAKHLMMQEDRGPDEK